MTLNNGNREDQPIGAPEYLTVGELAARLNYTEERIRQMLREGRLRGVKVVRKWLIPRAEIDSMLRMAPEEDAAQAETSGHWPGLRQAASKARTSLGSPMMQLLGLPWPNPRNGALILDNVRKRMEVSLSWERDVFFEPLKEHLVAHTIWRDLELWKSSVADLAERLGALSDWAWRQPELMGKDWVSAGDIERGKTGITDWFAKTVVLAAVEDAGLGVNAPKAWEYAPPNDLRGSWVLRWTYYSSSFCNVAACNSREELEAAAEIHTRMQGQMGNLSEISDLMPMDANVTALRIQLEKELEWVSALARFPGVCSLWQASDVTQ